MNRNIIAIAAALAAATTISDVANAGGLRLGFGAPLGSFVAHSASQQARYSAYGSRRCAKPAATRSYSAARHAKPEKTVVAHKVQRTAKSEETKVATTTKTPVTTDAAPAIFVPPTLETSELAGTQSTPTPVKAAAIETGTVTETVKAAEPAKTEEPAKKDEDETVTIEPVKNVKLEVPASVCRRFSAAIGQLIEVPCGN